MILAGDIGGTNTRMALFDEAARPRRPRVLKVYASPSYNDFAGIVDDFLLTHRPVVEQACFGIAGPVRHGVCHASNLPWIVDVRALQARLSTGAVTLINDLEANAHGIAELAAEDFTVIQQGKRDPKGNAALISPGTGLGEAGLTNIGGAYVPFATEGGHVDFAPRTPIEIDLLSHALRADRHVSYERFVSGPGLLNIYRYFRDSGCHEEPAWLAREMGRGDPAAVVSTYGLDGGAEICVRALDVFVSMLGAEAGNLALKMLATGGLYLGGGIVPRMMEKIRAPAFLDAFCAKGRMADLLKDIPIFAITNANAALLGAARVATDALAAPRTVSIG